MSFALVMYYAQKHMETKIILMIICFFVASYGFHYMLVRSAIIHHRAITATLVVGLSLFVSLFSGPLTVLLWTSGYAIEMDSEYSVTSGS